MLLLEIVVILVVLALGFMYVLRLTLAANERRQPWTIEEKSDGETLNVFVARGPEQPLLVEAIPFADDDFEMKLYEARAKAAERLIALNEGRNQLR